MSFLELRGLTKRFGDVVAVNDATLGIERGQFVTFLGPSGCGKTTALRMLAGFLAPDGGEIAVGGKVLSSATSLVMPEARGMGMVFQNYAVWPHMTVFENVAYGLRARRTPEADIRKRVLRTLEGLSLNGLEKRHPHELSGGQQQRVALARSLVVEPSILLLDEPLSNLDAKLRERTRSELKRLQRTTGITFIYVTHDQTEALAMSDVVAIFNHGRLEQYGDPRALYERPETMFVADFLGAVNTLPCGADGGFDPAGTYTAVVRPENIALSAALNGDPRGLRGVVTEMTYLGNLIEYQIDAPPLKMRVQTSRRDGIFNEGDCVYASLPASACTIIHER